MDIKEMLMGVDSTNEIFTLWYEITFIRAVLNEIMAKNPSLHINMTEEVYDKCRLFAQNVVKEKFPLAGLDFSEPSPEQIEKKKQRIENLQKLNKQLGGVLLGKPNHDKANENEEESPCCIPQDPSKSPDVFHHPLNES